MARSACPKCNQYFARHQYLWKFGLGGARTPKLVTYFCQNCRTPLIVNFGRRSMMLASGGLLLLFAAVLCAIILDQKEGYPFTPFLAAAIAFLILLVVTRNSITVRLRFPPKGQQQLQSGLEETESGGKVLVRLRRGAEEFLFGALYLLLAIALALATLDMTFPNEETFGGLLWATLIVVFGGAGVAVLYRFVFGRGTVTSTEISYGAYWPDSDALPWRNLLSIRANPKKNRFDLDFIGGKSLLLPIQLKGIDELLDIANASGHQITWPAHEIGEWRPY